MSQKVFIPQPIPEIAVNRLSEIAEVEVFPQVDRVIGDEDLLVALGQDLHPGGYLVPGAIGGEQRDGKRKIARQ